MTVMDVNAVVINWKNQIATLDVIKSYDKVRRRILLDDFKKVLETKLIDMLTACLQDLKVITKEDETGNQEKIRLGLTKGTPLSPILFPVYINDLRAFCRRRMQKEVVAKKVGKAEVIMTADNVHLHTSSWADMYTWLAAFSWWAYKKRMTWESTECKVICQSEEEVKDYSFKLYISGKHISILVSDTYIRIKMTS